MKLYYEIFKLLFNRYVRRQSMGEAVRKFAEHMGLTYIKLAQILATQNYGKFFTEDDRRVLSRICDDCNPLSFAEIETILEQEYGDSLDNFREIDEEPVGAASISQVHRAVLQTGEVVAIKIKRQDITRTVERDIAQIRRLIRRFGRFVHFRNIIGSNHSLDLYTKWIYEETDFVHERQNIKAYAEFAASVNGKVKGAKSVCVPKLYEDLCTENVLVMEFIEDKTLNQLELTTENREKIVTAMNSYICNSFYALLHGLPVIFHGDPHGGNIYLTKNGDVGFLDMGLTFELSVSERKMVLEFFLSAYTGDAEKLLEILRPYSKMSEADFAKFAEATKKYCEEVRDKEITYYFMDMVNVCTGYEIVPPDFLFRMAKAFICLNGISGFTYNHTVAHKLLAKQVTEFMIERTLEDCKSLIKDGAKLFPEMLAGILTHGVAAGIAEQLESMQALVADAKLSANHLKQAWNLLSESFRQR